MKLRKMAVGEPAIGQDFSPLVDSFHYDEALEAVVPDDTQVDTDKLIQSAASSTLDAILDRFLPGDIVPGQNNVRMTQDFLLDRFALMDEAQEAAEQIRAEYKLPESMTLAEIREFTFKKMKEDKNHVQKNESQQEAQSQAVPERSEASAQGQPGQV